MYRRPAVDEGEGGRAANLSASGSLWKDALVLRDDGSHSLWSQLEGRAIAGPGAGTELEVYPHERTTYAAWKERHPDTLVLVKEEGEGPGTASRYARYFEDPERMGIFGSANPDPRLAGKELVMGVRGREEKVAIPLAALARAGEVAFTVDGAPARCVYDRATGAVTCTAGEHALAATPVFWFAWATAYPDTRLVEPAPEQE